jgi:uncharacterized protein (DUF4415 family)
MPKTPRRPTDPMAAAEAAFKPVKKAAPPSAAANSRLPPAKELVSIRIDRDVLDHFQEDGPGWQDRINAALREAAGMTGSADEGKRPEELNATNDD